MGIIEKIKSVFKATPGVKIAILNVDVPSISDAEVQAAAKALTIQCQEHFSLPPPFGYGISATVRVVHKKSEIAKDEWALYLLSKPDVDGAYGYHDQTSTGLPLMKIFPLLDIKEGNPWTVTASHEVLETLADPNGARAAQDSSGKFWAYEVCDGVESTSYKIGEVFVSNFELTPYFEPMKSLKGLKLDYMGLCKKPMETLPGGYNQWFDSNKGWQQVQHAEKAPRPYRQNIKGRGFKRRGSFSVNANS